MCRAVSPPPHHDAASPDPPAAPASACLHAPSTDWLSALACFDFAWFHPQLSGQSSIGAVAQAQSLLPPAAAGSTWPLPSAVVTPVLV